MSYDATKSRWNKQVANYGDKPLAEGRRILVYGKYGCGKTTFAGTAPKPIFVDADYGENVSLREAKHPYWILRQEAPFDRLNAFLDDMLLKRDVFDPDGGPYADRQSLVIDSWTKVNELLLWEIGMTAKKPVDISREKPSIDMYQTLKLRQQGLVRKIKDLAVLRGINVISTALTLVEGEESEKLTRDSSEAMQKTGFQHIVGVPNLVGGYRGIIGAEFEEVYYIELVNAAQQFRRFHTRPYQEWTAKTRLPLPPQIDQAGEKDGPSFNAIMKLASRT